eukprot:TRINITY_DN8459_c1_g1_i1.p1 TRINITY_DN8459_c1_g1~~TRINITY_DN8459_c1_g1_i1.p1  ORF type:complete len:106 (+),score=20.99 TRINITY_DN8459_c1_g1_i1:45-362(+)
MPDDLCNRLAREQDIKAPYLDSDGKPDEESFRKHIETGHCFVDFETRPGKGVTSLNSKIEKGSIEEGIYSFVGQPIKLNGTKIRVQAKITLATMTGTGCAVLMED